ncbi:MAG: leucine-rich repeat domain-containing protein, partial [Treponema sp.]|nr:leucine-rich repeat domain-containing protein [Treponema sp.]
MKPCTARALALLVPAALAACTGVGSGGGLSGAGEITALSIGGVTGVTGPNRTVTVRRESPAPDAGIGTCLAAASGGANAADPVILPVSIDLSNAADWADLLSAINAAGKFAALDLSACTGMTEFDPGNTISTGKDKIVSLILPDTATGVKAGAGPGDAAFKYFTALTSVTGAAITGIGGFAFYDCTGLTTVSLPAAENIGLYAFPNCTGLTTVSLPAAARIGDLAFYYCTGLTSVSLPAAAGIGSAAFIGCTGLDSVSLPAAASIGSAAFIGCTGLTSVSLPAAESIGSYAF